MLIWKLMMRAWKCCDYGKIDAYFDLMALEEDYTQVRMVD